MEEIKPAGRLDSKIMIIGANPGRTDLAKGRPFSGSLGDQLTTFLRMSGISMSECYLTYLCKYYPTGGSFKRKFVDKKEYSPEYWNLVEELKREIDKVKPNVIVTLGNYPLYGLTGHDGAHNWRGSIIDYEQGKLIPVIGMSQVRRNYSEYFPLTLMDFSRIAREKEFPEVDTKPYTLITAPTLAEVQEAFSEIMAMKEPTAFDIETLCGTEIDMVSFCADPSWSICVPLCHTSGEPYWDIDSHTKVYKLIAEFLRSESVGKIAQNANFDILFMERYGFEVNNLYMDTMNAHHCCYPQLPKGLDTITSIYTKLPYFKDQSTERRQEYNALDSLATKRASIDIERELEEMGLTSFYFDYVRELGTEYRKVSDRGLKFLADKRDEIEAEMQPQYDKMEIALTDLLGQDIAKAVDTDTKASRDRKEELREKYSWDKEYLVNPRSYAQLAEVFYKHLGYYVYKNKGKPTTNDDALTKMIRRYDSEPARLVKKLREVGKELNTYIKMKIDPDNRVRTIYSVSGTNSGRLASRKTPFGTGANLQNIPKSPFRRLFVPDYDDYVFVEGDLAGADAMIVAYDSGDPGLINIFESGADYHSTNAQRIFGIDVPNPNHVEKYDVPGENRKVAKAIGHGANYGVSSYTVSMMLEIPKAEAQKLLNAYYSSYPLIKDWHRRIQNKLRKDRTLVTPMGRKSQFFGRWGDSLFQEAYSYIPQSTVGDIIHVGFLALQKKLPKWAWVSLNVHDSLVVQCPRSKIQETVAIMKECMEFPIHINGRDITVPVDFEWGENWYDLKEVK